ncbi:unnamed protein product [Prunus armeniaca]
MGDQVNQGENPLVRTLNDYLHPSRTASPSCTVFPDNMPNYDFKTGMIQLIPGIEDSTVCVWGAIVPWLDYSFPSQMSIENSAMWPNKTIPELDCFPWYILASQGCVGGALVKQDKVGRHVFWAGNWQPRHGRSAAQHTRKVAQCARQAAQCKAALNAQGRLHSARGQIVLDVGKTVFEQSMGGWTWLKHVPSSGEIFKEKNLPHDDMSGLQGGGL